ncbi:hypothetical protein OVA14_02835 [Agrococcus sp. SL85]|uniref:hypothetical protein n=1 Tax=Agrococcus sp. SL85 TaxID=2995141 RepID=UPI00226CF2A8|nr:hypothetical protein [Agrococcus sp. SL85]WAC66731.1 hypothetical protein OVA14_02835 [Agrococcus sp. SL85]
MTDEQQPTTSWRDRFFGSRPEDGAEAGSRPADAAAAEEPSAEATPDRAEVAATSASDADAHRSLVDHGATGEPAADTEVLDAQASQEAHDDRDGAIEPTVIAPSSLRGPSHSAAHPDDEHRHARDDDGSSLEAAAGADEPPALVEPRRPSFGLRRRADGEDGSVEGAGHDGAGHDGDAHDDDAHDDGRAHGGAAAGLAAGAAAGGVAAASTRRREEREFVEPEPTQAIEQQDAATRAMPAAGSEGDTRVLDAQPAGAGAPTAATERIGTDATATGTTGTERFGIVRDDRGPSTIDVDDETGRAAAAGGTPIVLVEEPLPPRRKGARGVGFLVAILATVLFAALLAGAALAVGYLFDREFVLADALQTLWLSPSYLLPVVVFFLAYWLVTLLVNRAGWWAHVLGAFLVAILAYAAHIVGAAMEARGGWGAVTELTDVTAQELGQLLLAPLSVLAFVIAREVPVWLGGIVSRRGRRAREWNRQAMDDFTNENAERLAAYERTRA